MTAHLLLADVSQAHAASFQSGVLNTHGLVKVRSQVLLTNHDTPCMTQGRGPKQGVWLNVDHLKPRMTHPHLSLGVSNCPILCSDCHNGQANWDRTDWR
jgi:5-methylcytosine-specific restriction endonuclease McrA